MNSILLPILSEKENNEEFLEKALKGTREVILLIVVDTESKEDFGFTTAHIHSARTTLEEIKITIGKKRKKCEDILEWGNTFNKIMNIALIKKVDKVILKKQENQLFEELVKNLKKEKIDVEVI